MFYTIFANVDKYHHGVIYEKNKKYRQEEEWLLQSDKAQRKQWSKRLGKHGVQKKLTKRSAGDDTDRKNSEGLLKRANSASAFLGLSVLLYPNKEEYDGVAQNSFFGFKVSMFILLFKSLLSNSLRPIGVFLFFSYMTP